MSLSRQQGDKFVHFTQAPERFSLNRWYDVEITGRGGHIQINVDGRLMLDYTDSTPLARGTIAFETLDNSAALVDDIDILPAGSAPTRTATRAATRVPTRAPTDTPTRAPTALPPTPTVYVPDIALRYWADQECLLDTDCTTLRWEVDNAQAVTLNGEGVGGYDSRPACPPGPVGEYTLQAVRGAQSVERTIVLRRVTADLRADRQQIQAGECTTVRWDVEGARAVYFNGEGVAGHDSRLVCPGVTTHYDLNVESDCGTVDRAVTVEVTAAPPSDTTGPSIGSIDTQPPGDTLCERSRIDVSVRITDDQSGVRNAELWVLFIPYNGIGSPYTVPLDRSGDIFTVSVTDLGLGELMIQVRAWDNAGNYSETVKRRIIITLC